MPAGEDVYILVQRGSMPSELTIDVTSEYEVYNGPIGASMTTNDFMTTSDKVWYKTTDRAEILIAAYENHKIEKPE